MIKQCLWMMLVIAVISNALRAGGESSPKQPSSCDVTDTTRVPRFAHIDRARDTWHKPVRMEGKDYWHGLVFVLPQAPESLLTVNGFRVERKEHSSARHDCYRVFWPVRLDLESLPKAICQVTYDVNREITLYESGADTTQEADVWMTVIRCLSPAVFKTLGFRANPFGCDSAGDWWTVRIPAGIVPDSLPLEIRGTRPLEHSETSEHRELMRLRKRKP